MTPLVKAMLLVFTASVIGSLGMAFLKMGSARLTRSIWSFLNFSLLTGIGMRELFRIEVAEPLNTDGLHLGRPPAGAKRWLDFGASTSWCGS